MYIQKPNMMMLYSNQSSFIIANRPQKILQYLLIRNQKCDSQRRILNFIIICNQLKTSKQRNRIINRNCELE
ncbi:hypothetical protein pb186bvf_011879 [Paramecium bursaria]